MSEETAIVIHKDIPQSYFMATNSQEMAESQKKLSQWVSAKITNINSEITEIQEAIDYAKKQKWCYKQLQVQKNRAHGRRMYYEKMLAALEAGYVMIPEFPMQSFAVRVSRYFPKGSDETTYNRAVSSPDQKADTLAVGEGRYVSPTAIDNTGSYKKQENGKDVLVRYANASEFQDIAFPLIASKPALMDAVSKTMALKIFDTLGIAPEYRKKGDPLIVGEIQIQANGYSRRTCRFLISWHINVEDL